MSTSYNNIVRSNAPKSLFEDAKPVLSTAVSYNQGDLIAFDTSLKILKAVTTTADSSNILGVARQKLTAGIAASPSQGTAVDASGAIESVAGPVYGVVAELTLKTSDAFNPGDKVYIVAADPQTVTVTDPSDGKYIGIYQDAAVASATAGQKGLILVGARYNLAGFSV